MTYITTRFALLTLFSSAIIDKFLKTQQVERSIGFAFFYCDSNHSQKQECLNFLGCLVKQLFPVAQLCTGSSLLENLKSSHQRHKQLHGSGRPSLEEMLLILKQAVSAIGRTYIIVDGLDECVHRELMLSIILEIMKTDTNLLITSRSEKEIEKVFLGERNLIVDEECVRADIQAHVTYVLNQDKHFARFDGNLKDEIKDKLLRKCAGM